MTEVYAAQLAGIYDFLRVALPFLGVLTVVVFIHEFGHFIVARKCGVTVDAFSIGMGPEICGFNDRHGTRWKLSWLPIGGYVRFVDDTNTASVPSAEGMDKLTPQQQAGAMQTKPLAQKAAILAAGPVFNIVSAILIYIMTFWLVGTYGADTIVDSLVPDGAAVRAGLKSGDRITAIDGRPVERFADIQRAVAQSSGQSLRFSVIRQNQPLDLTIAPVLTERTDPIGNKVKVGMIGVGAGKVFHEPHGLLDATKLGFSETFYVSKQIITAIPGLPAAIANVYRGQKQTELGGPIAIAKMTGKAAEGGVASLLVWVAVFSIMLGIMNLLPIPILDGGHLMLYALEAVRGRPLDERNQGMSAAIGAALLVTMMLAAIISDTRGPG